jgi:uncharacterized protein (DUF1697 family)
MPQLRDQLGEAGFEDVRTYVQSGNIVLCSEATEDQLVRRCKELIADKFGLEIDVVVRNRDELADVVARNPLADVAEDPRRYQVSFLQSELDASVVEQLNSSATEPERIVAIGRELYAWHPNGVARSKLWAKVAGKGLGTVATARNWTTVTTLLSMANEG